MNTILLKFKPYYRLLSYKDGEFYKTGTLHGVKTRAGYINIKGRLYPFVIMLNTPGKPIDKIVKELHKNKLDVFLSGGKAL